MKNITRFTVLIERRATLRWLAAGLVLGALAATALRPAQAAPRLLSDHKIARDLRDALDTGRGGDRRWSRDIGGQRHVQLIVIGDGSDPEMKALRAQVLRVGGSVHARHPLVNGLTVQVPRGQVQAIAQRADVKSVSPNRAVKRSASTLEAISGVLTSGVRSYAWGSYSGLDGSGVGIAVLDSGVMAAHRSFDDALGFSRVKKNVNLRRATLSDWLVGVDSTVSPAPGSAALANYEAAIDVTSGTSTHDPYGHGTHVAAVAAGRAFYQAPDSTGIAPGASLYDVRVLDSEGTGTLSDVLEGIQWVIFHAREHKIRVLNVSLAASSPSGSRRAALPPRR